MNDRPRRSPAASQEKDDFTIEGPYPSSPRYLGALRMILFLLVVAAAIWAAKYGVETYIGHPINSHDATLAPVSLVR